MMMVEERHLNDLELNTLFEAAKDAAPLPSTDLVTRILSDADRVLDANVAPAPDQQTKRGFFADILEAIGGWPSIAGLATAAVAGDTGDAG